MVEEQADLDPAWIIHLKLKIDVVILNFFESIFSFSAVLAISYSSFTLENSLS